jgi:hypothetical protein
MRLRNMALQVHLGVEHDELLVKANPSFAQEVFLREMIFLQGKSVERPTGSVPVTNQRIVVLETDRS